MGPGVDIDLDIDHDACMGSGTCISTAPGVFDLNDDAVAFVVDLDRVARARNQ